jgi:hypothetical protein
MHIPSDTIQTNTRGHLKTKKTAEYLSFRPKNAKTVQPHQYIEIYRVHMKELKIGRLKGSSFDYSRVQMI